MSAARRAATLLVVCGAGAALAAGAASVSAGTPASGPLCVPASLDASAQLPGTPLLVTPGARRARRDAADAAQLPRRAGRGSSSGLVVRGSVSGLHAGRLEAYSQGDGASFVPDTPFTVGEIVSVAGELDLRRRPRIPSATASRSAIRIRSPGCPSRGKPAGRPGTVWHFHSAPGLDARGADGDRRPPPRRRATATSSSPPTRAPARWARRSSTRAGQLVWFKPLAADTFATNLQVQRYRGRPVLTWWQGTISNHGFGLGEGEIYSSSYRPLATVHAGDGLTEDLHELQLDARRHRR